MCVPEVSDVTSIEPINSTIKARQEMHVNTEREQIWKNDIAMIAINYVCLFLHALNFEHSNDVCVFAGLFSVLECKYIVIGSVIIGLLVPVSAIHVMRKVVRIISNKEMILNNGKGDSSVSAHENNGRDGVLSKLNVHLLPTKMTACLEKL